MKRTCEHPACSCEHEAARMVERDGKYFCSTNCASADADADTCECGHPGCEGG